MDVLAIIWRIMYIYGVVENGPEMNIHVVQQRSMSRFSGYPRAYATGTLLLLLLLFFKCLGLKNPLLINCLLVTI